jgi:hypothetical protein
MSAAFPLFLPPRDGAATEEEDLRIPVQHARWHSPKGFLHAKARWAKAERAPAAVVLHGIAGSKDSHCVVRAGVALRQEGYHVVRLDMRGAGDSVVDAPSLYHAGLSTDLDLVVRRLLEDRRVSSVVILAFSGGGSPALKLAGEWGKDAPSGVAAIATVSAPLDYSKVAARMDTVGCLPYRFHVLRGLLDRARAFADHHPERAHYQPSDLDSIRRFRVYDERVIVPMHGFRDADRYYKEASAGPWLGRVAVPTLILHAEDDPMVPVETVRPWLGDASPAVTARLSTHGGHLGWLAGLDERSWTRPWATAAALEFFAAHVRPAAPRVAVAASPSPKASRRSRAEASLSVGLS